MAKDPARHAEQLRRDITRATGANRSLLQAELAELLAASNVVERSGMFVQSYNRSPIYRSGGLAWEDE